MKKLITPTIFFAGMFLLNLTCSNYHNDRYIKFYGNEVFIPEKLGRYLNFIKILMDSIFLKKVFLGFVFSPQ